jgi:methionine-rich copper-binding protein CopC
VGIARARSPGSGGVARLALGVLAVLGALCAAAPRAGAHAILVEATPADAARLSEAPAQLVLRFNSRIEHKLSRATLVAGEQRRPLTPDADAPPDRLIAPLPALGPGSYTVEWQVLSVDGHRVAGKLGFTVAGPS